MRFALGLLLFACASAQDPYYLPKGPQLPSPARSITGPDWRVQREEWRSVQAADYEKWFTELDRWRREQRARIGYSGAEYERPELQWTQRSFVQPQMMAEDRYFYDPTTRKYTVDRYLDDLERRYGGIDSVLIWPVYPNIGIDNRNQLDMHRDMPGGIPAMREMVQQFHRRGVKVLFPAMPWDNGTRVEGSPAAEATARLMAEIGADGINGDTMSGVPKAYRTASDKAGHPLVLEPEGAPPRDDALMWNNMSWGYWTYPFVPLVSKLKWLESRHMVHVCNRWARDRNDDLQFAFFNGVGFESWENVWGIWNGITPRDAEALRRIAAIERATAALLVSPNWRPYVPTLQFGVFASRFPGTGVELYTLVNRNEFSVSGEQLSIPHRGGRRYFDLWSGVELKPRLAGAEAALAFSLEGRGFAAVLTLDAGALWPKLDALLVRMAGWAKRPLATYSREWKPLPQKVVEIPRTPPGRSAAAGMIDIPGGEFDFQVTGTAIEGFNWNGLDIQYSWEDSPRRAHRQRVTIRPFRMDKYPVTNAEFRRFHEATKYRPADAHNFLKDWKDGSIPAGWEQKPVTWVSLEDARAYAAWAGKRLPHEWEWQYAAQGKDARVYPWGNEWDAARAPEPYLGRELPGPADVDAHPRGASAFGVEDMVGNVWQWTDEYIDEHTRAAVLRGGSYYRPQGSEWYFPQALRLDQHGKYLLMAPGKDRAATLGFRCVKDRD